MSSASGVKNLRRIQMGRQANWNTAVPATTIWRGPGLTPNDEQTKVIPKENIGVSSATTRQYTPRKYSTIDLPSVEATFQQILHPLEAGIKTVAPIADGAGSGFISLYPFSYADGNTTKPYTIEGGNNKVVEEIEDAFVLEMTLSGKKNESWMMQSKWGGRQSTVSAFTGALAVPSVSEMLFNRSKLFIDDVDGTLGTTQIVNSWIEATLKLTTGLKAQFTAEGNLYFSFVDFIGAKATLELSLLHNAVTAAERVLWKSDTPRQIRMLIEGKDLASAGTLYSKETFMSDLAGVYTQFGSPNDEDEGSDVMKVSFEAGYDATAALFANLTVVHELSAIP